MDNRFRWKLLFLRSLRYFLNPNKSRIIEFVCFPGFIYLALPSASLKEPASEWDGGIETIKKCETIWLLLISIFVISGCGPIKMYSGPNLSPEEIAIIKKDVNIGWVDGKGLGPSSKWRDLEVVQGKHTLRVSLVDVDPNMWSVSNDPIPWLLSGPSKNICIPFQDLSFTAIAHHTYYVYGLVDSKGDAVIRIKDLNENKILAVTDPDKECKPLKLY